MNGKSLSYLIPIVGRLLAEGGSRKQVCAYGPKLRCEIYCKLILIFSAHLKSFRLDYLC